MGLTAWHAADRSSKRRCVRRGCLGRGGNCSAYSLYALLVMSYIKQKGISPRSNRTYPPLLYVLRLWPSVRDLCTVWGIRLFRRFCEMFSGSFTCRPLLVWAAQQLQHRPDGMWNIYEICSQPFRTTWPPYCMMCVSSLQEVFLLLISLALHLRVWESDLAEPQLSWD